MEQISEKEAIRIAEAALSANFSDREMGSVRLKKERVFPEGAVELLGKSGFSSDAIAGDELAECEHGADEQSATAPQSDRE